ncbi:class I SAM-dependent methyltransferase [Metabacillus idriensis]|uniref:class I SAM-dependent methyltransferase n=1 Tax=Metabacillus idriensis TaxID=324768 RepID=UPI00174A25F6|nr:class I SAM-dependent methyltransferase [Metabacillus idriensis]
MFSAFTKNFSKPKGFLGIIAGKIMALENQTINKWSISRLKIKPGDTILEIGFGPGYSMGYMLKHYRQIKIDGVDVSETMKEQAEKHLEAYVEAGRVNLITEDAENVDLYHDYYDKILSVNNYTIWEDPRKGLENITSALKPGGRIAITMQPREEDASAEKTRMFGRKIQDDMSACGYEDIKVEYKKVRPELTVCVTGRKRKI